jgi:hypothetical protein
MLHILPTRGDHKIAEPGLVTTDALWLDLLNPTSAEVTSVEKRSAAKLEIESSSRLRSRGGILYMSTPSAAGRPEGAQTTPPIGFVLSTDRLVTVRFMPLPSFDVWQLPGAAGAGPKRAAQLLRRRATLNGALEVGLFQTQAEMLRLYRLIATMDAKAPLPSLDDQQPTWGSASTFARRWELNELADRLDEKAWRCGGIDESPKGAFSEACLSLSDWDPQRVHAPYRSNGFGCAESDRPTPSQND